MNYYLMFNYFKFNNKQVTHKTLTNSSELLLLFDSGGDRIVAPIR